MGEAGQRAKTDPVDAAMLAAVGRQGGGASSVRRALLRAVLVGLACGAAGILIASLGDRGGDAARTLALFGLLLGAVAGAVGAFEGPVAARTASRKGHLLAAAAVALVGAVGAALGLAQAAYVVTLAQEGTVNAGLEEAMRLLGKVGQDPGEALALFGGLGLVLGGVTFARLRGLGLLAQLGSGLLVWAALVLPAALLAFRDWNRDRNAALGLCAAFALGLPPLARLADAVERRVWPPRD